MHYANGREAKVGDRVYKPGDQNNLPQTGVLVEVQPGSTSCNGKILPANIAWNLGSITISECYHADDVTFPPKQAVAK